MKDIYKMKLHETIIIIKDALIVTRVPGGWIYETNSDPDTENWNAVYVPFISNEKFNYEG